MRSPILGISASLSDEYLLVRVGTVDPLARPLARSVRYFDKVEDGTKLDE
jgi:hypothetical protein